MPVLNVKIQDSAFGNFSRSSTHQALAELIWNALDADASNVQVEFIESDGSGGLAEIRVIDDGEGVSDKDLHDGFENLGTSWKKHASQTRRFGRVLHGKEGQGRYKVYALGKKASWETVIKNGDSYFGYTIKGNASNPRQFEYSEPILRKGATKTGTTLVIGDICPAAKNLKRQSAIEEIHKTFALYLKRYPSIRVSLNGEMIDPKCVQTHEATYPVQVNKGDGLLFVGQLVIVEWSFSTSQSIIICNSKGVALTDQSIRVPSHGISFTAYLNSEWFDAKDPSEIEGLTLNPAYQGIYRAITEQVKIHLSERTKQAEIDIIEKWKADNVYPFQEEPKSVRESIEQSVFASCAVELHKRLPDFAKSSAKSQRLSLRLVREALETNPDSLKTILEEVLGLSPTEQDDFAELIRETKLSTIIKASKVITDRLKFLDGLDILLFDQESKKALKERSQLHKLLEQHAWVFGEEFHLSVSDQHLTRALERHVKFLGRDEANLDRVKAIDGGDPGIIDLMLSKTIQRGEAEFEHLIVELKRPIQPIDDEVISQVRKYALAVAADDRFRGAKVKWRVWAVSNRLSESVRLDARQKDKPIGLLKDYEDPPLQIWAKPWGEILEDCRNRLKFFKDQLDYVPGQESALDYLRGVNPAFLPESLRTRQPSPESPSGEGETA